MLSDCCLSVCLSCPVCKVGVLWPNGWTDQDETWHAGRPPIFGPCPLWPNGCMDQGATCYRGRPRPWPYCARWGPSSSLQKGGTAPEFSAHVCYGQMAGWIKMPPGTMVGLGPGNILLVVDTAPSPRGTAPKFWPMSVVAKWLDGSRCHLVWR